MNRTKAGAWVSPYTPQNLDTAITHLERVLCAESVDSLFAQTYWHGRVLQAYATPGLLRLQQERLQRLLDRVASASAESGRLMHGAPDFSRRGSEHPDTSSERPTSVKRPDGASTSLRMTQNHRARHALRVK